MAQTDKLLRVAPYLLLAATVAWLAQRASGPLVDPDAWWHLRLGEDFLRSGSLSPPQHWSTFATSSWVPTQPVPEIVTALVDRAGGPAGVVWLYVATVVAVVVATYVVCRRYAAPLAAVVATMAFVAAGEGALTPRPQLVSYLLLLVVVEVWLRTEQDLRPRWWLVPLSWLWSLCHGFWFVGVAYGVACLVGLALGRRPGRGPLVRLGLLAAACGGVVLLNPVGPGVFRAPFGVSARGRYITEWQHAALTSGPTLIVLLMCLAVALVWVTRRERVTAFRVVLLLSAVFWSWYSVRTVVLGAIVVAPLLAAALQSLVATTPDEVGPAALRRERLPLLGAAATLLAVMALVVPATSSRPGVVPTALGPHLDRLPAGTTVLNDFTLGGWLAWTHPDLNRYIDGLADAYPVSHLRDDSRLMSLDPGWQALVRRSGATYALLESRSSVATRLEQRGWRSAGTDRGWVLLAAPGASP